MNTRTMRVDPATVLLFALNGIRAGVEDMEGAIKAQDGAKLTEAIDKLVTITVSAQDAIAKGALESK